MDKKLHQRKIKEKNKIKQKMQFDIIKECMKKNRNNMDRFNDFLEEDSKQFFKEIPDQKLKEKKDQHSNSLQSKNLVKALAVNNAPTGEMIANLKKEFFGR